MMLKTALQGPLVATLLACTALSATAQPTPFDMTPESGLRVQPAPVPAPVTPAPQQPVAPVAPPAPVEFSRNILPFEQFQLVGEDTRRAVNLYLSQAQADAAATLEVGYVNAIVASPEASSLELLINGTSLISTPIASSADVSRLEIAVPPGLLRAGANVIEFDAHQRHRTDCSISSTYELWTQIDPATTVMRFDGEGLARVSQLGEIAAIGFDQTGNTTLRLIAPDISNAEVAAGAIQLVQTIALALRVPELKVELLSDLPAETPQGTINIILGTAAQLPASVAQMQGQASTGPLAAFAPVGTPANTLVVSGPEWGSVTAAIRAIAEATNLGDPSMLPQRVDIAEPVPRIEGGTTLTLSDLGVRTTQFNGRRYRTSFEFALPADFYANQYGQAQMVLDAAYSSDVLPGSQFDIYANGQIASATPVLRTDGGVQRDTRIKFPMTSFRPGRNEIDIEVIILTDADNACPPGLTQRAAERFLFSSTTQFVIPDFARAEALPNLQTFAGTGAPYVSGEPVKLMMSSGTDVLPAAMTWLARVAVASGVSVPVTLVTEAEVDPKTNLLVVAPQPELSAAMLGRSGVLRGGTDGSTATADSAVLQQFNDGVGASGGGALGAAQSWVADRIGIPPENLQLFSPPDQAYAPPSDDAVIMAQVVQPEGGIWTYLTIPEGTALLTATQRLTQTDNWRAISGRVSALGSRDANVISVRPNNVTIVQTQPWSVGNMRLLAANWLSANILQFTALLAGTALLLTLATAALLKSLGRES